MRAGKAGAMWRIPAGVLIAATSAVLVLASSPAYAANGASISVSPSSVAPGGTVHISGTLPFSGCPQTDTVRVTGESSLFPPDGFGPTASRDAQGDFELDYTVPTSTTAGTYEIAMRCGGANPGVSASLTVTAVPVGAPQTGAGGAARGSSRPWVVLGLACLSLGGLTIGLRRRLAGRAV